MANPISEQNKSAALNFDPDLINSVITEKGLQDLKNSKEKVEEIKREIATLLDQPRPLAAESRPVEKLNSVETDALLAFSLIDEFGQRSLLAAGHFGSQFQIFKS